MDQGKLDVFFNTLKSVELSDIAGMWLGGYLPTGKLIESILVKHKYVHWHGKKFKNENKVKAFIVNILGLKFNIPFMTARLRPILFRGEVSAALIYNYLPVIDYFRKIDESKIMGVMEWKGKVKIYFYLVRK